MFRPSIPTLFESTTRRFFLLYMHNVMDAETKITAARADMTMTAMAAPLSGRPVV